MADNELEPLRWCEVCRAAHSGPEHPSPFRPKQGSSRKFVTAGQREHQSSVGLAPCDIKTKWFHDTLPYNPPERRIPIGESTPTGNERSAKPLGPE